MDSKTQIDLHMKQATRIALSEIERHAREVMRAHPEIKTFIMAMGSACFYDAEGPMDDEVYPEIAALMDFIGEFDRSLHLTGSPMRLDSARGPVVHDW